MPAKKTWTEQQDALLGVLYLTTPHAEIADRLGKTPLAVRNRCWRLGLRKDEECWTAGELSALRQAYAAAGSGPVNQHALASRIGRTPQSVATCAHRLGLSNYGRSRGEGHAQWFQQQVLRSRAEKGHPRGMLGVKHTPESRAKMSVGQRAAAANRPPRVYTQEQRRQRSELSTKQMLSSGNAYSRCKHGRRPDLGGQYFRSSWEANYARFLNLLIAQGRITKWEYEADTFWFEAVRRGVRSYTPDFKVTEPAGRVYYIEVKGWMDAKSKTKLKRMKKYHPSIDLRLVDAKAYREINRKLGGAIPGWEAA